MKESKKYRSFFPVFRLKTTNINDAIKVFNAYKRDKVIISGTFDSNSWTLNDEIHEYTFNFSFTNKKKLSDFCKYIKIDKNDFIMYLKTYIVLRLGELALSTLQSTILGIKQVVAYDIDNLENIPEDESLPAIWRVVEFFTVLPITNNKKQLDKINHSLELAEDKWISMQRYNLRHLASFDTYMKFDEIMTKYWKECDSVIDKLFYFPLWLWWQLTAIIPQRPREFMLTPRNCLSYKNGKYYFLYARDKLKGKNKQHQYKVSGDYTYDEYVITDYVAKEIQWYINCTEKYYVDENNLLFVTDTHYMKWGRNKSYLCKMLSYVCFNTILYYFYKEIIEEKYGYEIVENKELSFIDSNQIQIINLGDTRHIAMIGLLASGGDPVLAMALSGHESLSNGNNYYGNIAQYLDCMIVRELNDKKGSKQHFSVSKPLEYVSDKEYTLLSDGTKCYSKKYRLSDFSDCKESIGPNCELGFCPSCIYHADKNKYFSDMKDFYANKLTSRQKSLFENVKMYRQSKGYKEDIIIDLNMLKHEAYSYKRFRRLSMEDNKNGKKKRNKQ